ncbi:MAG: four-carbon acid sugar kinase family protein [Hyphomicrobiaceae bacterium]|nr:MAG: four-carbon acid sugar kinase family protein [Hyphomicrobiaceae bacterium]
MLLGCIADDLTGATDLALALTRGGMRTVQVMGVPEGLSGLDGADAVVVALKSRTNPSAQAVAWSLAAADRLLAAGARQLFFKYCSTFDSTDKGNIGPVAEALLAKTGAEIAIATPAFPTNGRTVYLGHLFVGDVPLAESPMRDHPLTPMRDSNLVRVLARQTRLKTGLVPYPAVDEGADTIGQAFARASSKGERLLIADALTDRHLYEIGGAVARHKLVTGGSGVAIGLPRNFIESGQMQARPAPRTIAAPKGRMAIIAGSCSEATRGQVRAAIAAGIPALAVDPIKIHAKATSADDMLRWAFAQPEGRPILVYSSADPAVVKGVQDELGREKAGALVEKELAALAKGLVEKGVSKLIVAGGETSGAVVGVLGVAALEIGPEIDPGVPWTRAIGHDLVLALKSGNFGAPDFFLKAWDRLS